MEQLSPSVPDVGARRRAKVSGSKVKALRAEKGLTQRDLAEKVRVEQRTVARWEQEKADGTVIGEIDFVAWLGVLNAFGLPPDWEPAETPLASPSTKTPT